jgi:hypothetical protein
VSEKDATSIVRMWLDVVDRALATERGRRQLVGVVVLLTVLGATGSGLLLGPRVAILVLAGGALVAAIGLFWASLRALFGETKLSPEDAYAIGAPSAEEEQKRAVLRAIKDLEFEHAVGKISSEDYQILLSKYRNEAKRLLRVLDERALPGRAAVERLVDEHLAARGLAKDKAAKEEPPKEEVDA